MIIDADNKHMTSGSCYRISYFRKGIACGVKEDWTYAKMTVYGKANPTGTDYIVMEFDRSEETQMRHTKGVLELAFDSGKEAKAKEIRTVLGL